MRSIKSDQSNHRNKPVMHLMLGVVMETHGADFPLHWLPSDYRYFCDYFQERQLKEVREVHKDRKSYEKFTGKPYFS